MKKMGNVRQCGNALWEYRNLMWEESVGLSTELSKHMMLAFHVVHGLVNTLICFVMYK